MKEYPNNATLAEDEYVKPQIEIMEIENEGILAASGVGTSGNPSYWRDGGEW